MGTSGCDNFQYEGTLRKFERVGLGENVDVDEEEGKEEVFKVRRYVAKGSREAGLRLSWNSVFGGNESARGQPQQKITKVVSSLVYS